MEITTIGLDLAKNVFQVHGVDATGKVVVRKALRRVQMISFFTKLAPCLIGMEACGTSHHWAREQQAALFLHRTRSLLVKQRTQLINMMRGQLAEFGVDIPKGLERALTMARQIIDGEAAIDLPSYGVKMLAILCRQALATHVQIREIDRELQKLERSNEMARRLATIPGIGPIGATAFAAAVTDPAQFRSGRQFAAWLGLTPLQNSSGGKERHGRISKMGDQYLRRLLVIGATAMVRQFKMRPEKTPPQVAALLARKPVRVATVAMANKMARIVWALMARGETYRVGHMPALAA
ncbi:IS110 family RNA-guided transposase [Kozakia baliensis]|uniref:Transposase n=1 Tax=Kozakia baliensis TaxID=153496 RepID=A0A1D8UW90_9PROT|nr:IS110 family transposase [Kozakia baliensis]AOX17767.1 transposase [Kozakia baliensis]GBR23824.1 transposase [Kozakia baliensis NRIC 0488]GEL65591.1 IS110 family transposase [Kozakia baliensis]